MKVEGDTIKDQVRWYFEYCFEQTLQRFPVKKVWEVKGWRAQAQDDKHLGSQEVWICYKGKSYKNETLVANTWLLLCECLRKWQCTHQKPNSCYFMLPDEELLGVVKEIEAKTENLTIENCILKSDYCKDLKMKRHQFLLDSA